MAINFIPNDPLAGATAPAMRTQSKHANRPASRAGFTFTNLSPEGVFAPGTAGFLFWQCREAGLLALAAIEASAGTLSRWQGNRKKLPLLQDAGVDVNAFYDRFSFSFFHRAIQGQTVFSGASTDVVAHEVGHGILDSLRPDLWDAPFLETGACHEAFGDCIAILTALEDRQTRDKLLAATTTLRKKNFVESTAEQLSDAIRRLIPTHNAAEPRHAFNTFQFQLPETLPDDGGPGELINEVHSFGMLFSGCFYDLIAGLFAAQASQTQATLLASARLAGAILVGGMKTALITPRFFQAVGRAMVLADEQDRGGANREAIKAAFAGHNIMLGANALLAPTAVLDGAAPAGRAAALGASTRRDLSARLGVARGGRLAVEPAELAGERVARVVHTQPVSLSGLHPRLKGVSVIAPVTVTVGASGSRAAVMGALPEPISTEREVQTFVEALLRHGQIEMAPAATAGRARGAAAGMGAKAQAVRRETHAVKMVRGKKMLVRVRFHCGCRVASAL
jgi:hypothetical protein